MQYSFAFEALHSSSEAPVDGSLNRLVHRQQPNTLKTG